MKVLSKGSGTRAVAVVLACAALQVAAQAQGPGETLTGVEARAARLGHAADVVITGVRTATRRRRSSKAGRCGCGWPG